MSNVNFTQTCEVIDLRSCQNGATYLDPCDCRRYYQCTNDFSMSTLSCNNGTLWDYTLSICNHDRTVEVNQPCEATNSWERCNTTDIRLEVLRLQCTGGSTTITPNITAKPPEAPASKVNPGMVAGLILAGAVITLAAIALFVLYSRRKKARARRAKRQSTIENREYFQNNTTEDPYAIIDDRMISARHNQNNNNNNTISSSRNGTISTTTTTLPSDEPMTVYDNSAFRDEESPAHRDGDYTSTLDRAPVNPYDTLSASGKSYEKPRNSANNGDLASNGGIVPGTSDINTDTLNESVNRHTDIAEETPPESDTDSDAYDDVQSPDYYKLEKET